jgi:hypothetical protein
MGRVFGSLRDALHATATGAKLPMKALAAELDWSPSELSMRTTLGGDNGRAFPADDEHLIRMQRVTEDVSVLYTMADLLGFEVLPKRERTAELLVQVQRDLRELMPRIQMVLNIGAEPVVKGTKR